MAAFPIRSNLSRGNLDLFLRNDEGHLQDGYNVKWTIYHDDGRLVSGLNVPANKADVGEYYAQWGCANSNGCYKIIWQYQTSLDASVQTITESFFIVDPASYGCCAIDVACLKSVPDSGCGVFPLGQTLGIGNLSLFIKDDNGIPQNAFAIYWTIFNILNNPITLRLPATFSGNIGEYFASWNINTIGGNYYIKWEFMLNPDSMLESICMSFFILSGNNFIKFPTSICGGCNPNDSCCSTTFIQDSICIPCSKC
jgi:hypothetical protein